MNIVLREIIYSEHICVFKDFTRISLAPVGTSITPFSGGQITSQLAGLPIKRPPLFPAIPRKLA